MPRRVGTSISDPSAAWTKLIGTSLYQYRVTALSDLNHNDEEDPGETDVAPDTGFYQHRL